ncbi:MAG TPA: dienelactone hydrolase family protein [Vicinamibacterales bacterium]|nr:dienelactone hydrolase family protein [Vicinamibacterales bacterium]
MSKPSVLPAVLVSASLTIVAGCLAQEAPIATTGTDDTASVDRTVVLNIDDWELHGAWRAPAGSCRHPAALLLHNAAGSRAEHQALAEALLGRGVASLALDLRGHGESINLGRFEPPYPEHLHINADAYRDIIGALRWLGENDNVDAGRLAVLGASYSGEAAAIAFREGARAQAYVMMSPGDFSDESIAMIDGSGAAWLFVRTGEEGQPSTKAAIDEIHEGLSQHARTAESKVYPGTGHATRILTMNPESVTDIADWIAQRLDARPCASRQD